MKSKKYKSIIFSVTININPYGSDVLYIVSYAGGKIRCFLHYDLSYDLLQRINNFINTGTLFYMSKDKTITVYKNGLQNVID